MYDPVDLITAAVVDRLNTGEFAESFTATAPDYLEVDETDHDLHVAVFPRSEETESWWTDDTDRSEIAVAILIRQTLDSYTAARVAELKSLAREIRDDLRNAHPLVSIGDYPVNLDTIQHEPLWSPELLRVQQLFLSILLITYRTEYEVT